MSELSLFLEDLDFSSEEDIAMLEDYFEACDESEEKELDVLCEGTNLDIRKRFKEYKKKHKMIIKELKKQLKMGHYDEASKLLKELKQECEEVHKKILDTPSTIGSVIFGLWTSWTVTFGRDLALCLTIVGIPAAELLSFIENYGKLFRDLFNGELNLDSFNLYKNKIDACFKTFEANIKRLEMKLDELQKGDSMSESYLDDIDSMLAFLESADPEDPEDAEMIESILEFTDHETGNFGSDSEEFMESDDENYGDNSDDSISKKNDTIRLKVYENYSEDLISDDDKNFLLSIL